MPIAFANLFFRERTQTKKICRDCRHWDRSSSWCMKIAEWDETTVSDDQASIDTWYVADDNDIAVYLKTEWFFGCTLWETK